MTPAQVFLAKLKAIAALGAELPKGASVVVHWENAPNDLLLGVAMLPRGHLHSLQFVGGGELARALWKHGVLVVRAEQRKKSASQSGPMLTLVKP